MSLSPREAARRAQLTASDPAVSAFTSASAGSGKTKLLTDRLLRLMLSGVPPERILCLTFTRAAAAEMALRLRRRLAAWAVRASAELDADLSSLGVAPGEETRKAARRLFGTVLDLPGGMRISTIHAFCQSVLRRFPLEAELPPHFEVAADEDTALARHEAIRGVLAKALDDPVRAAALARLVGATTFEGALDRACAEIWAKEEFARARTLDPEALAAAFRRVAGAPEKPIDRADVANEAAVRAAAGKVAAHGAAEAAANAERVLAWLELAPLERRERFEEWAGLFLNKDGTPKSAKGLVNPALQRQQPELLDALEREQERVLAVRDAEYAMETALVSSDLYAFAEPALAAYRKIKGAQGRLDYADLIRLTGKLLANPGAAWVLYKLDGGLDHLLLDEAQDTARAQWRIAEALTAEFFAGHGAREEHRTVFAVGDPKQSIFSFQGADPEGFERARRFFGAHVEAARERWVEEPLNVSFRSSAPVLALVDAVFADERAARGVTLPLRLHHDSARIGAAGMVALWPLAPPDPRPDLEPWSVPERNLNRTSGARRLAEALARWIAEETSGRARLPSRNRPIEPGDVLVLVRRRNAFGRALMRGLKAAGVPVSGLDRIALAEEPVVRDLLALGHALLLPEDDLAFATFLTSPLGGLDDDDLLALCPRRKEPLFKVLEARQDERPSWRAAYAIFATLFRRADFVSPHALLAEALGPLGGRARLYARFGMEAAEPLDELLAAALRYAEANAPSLEGFLHWIGHAGTEVKREPEGTGKVVRLMTVHGAKGLQAPIVVLPDTTGDPNRASTREPRITLLAAADRVSGATLPLILPEKKLRSNAIRGLLDAQKSKVLAEHNRLLYVALTRAEDRLVVAGAGTDSAPSEDCWYRAIERGFARLGAESAPFRGGWDGRALRFSCPQTAPVEKPEARGGDAEVPLPAWAGQAPSWRALPPPPEEEPPRPLAPSRPENIAFGSVPPAASPLALRDAQGRRFRRGSLVHAALQHLANIPPEERGARLRHFFGEATYGFSAAEAERLALSVENVIAAPALAALFGKGARSEVPLTGLVNGRVVGGVVDRLVVLPDHVLVADFKTNRRPPPTPAEAPPLYLAQMAAYRAVLAAIFPNRPVVCWLVWTEIPRVDRLPEWALDLHNPSPTRAQGFPA